MTSAAEVFVVQLARVSRKAKRVVRYLPKDDRDDVMAIALLWCWEHRESYSLTTSLDTWFVNAVRNALQQWRRGEHRKGVQVLDEIPTGDSTLAAVEALEAAAKLAAALPPEYRRVAEMHALGYSRAAMMAEGMSKDTIDATRARIKRLRRLVPNEHEFRRLLRAGHPDLNSDSVGTDKVNSYNSVSTIDRDIEELEAMPRHGADCPPCWKCKYFEGYLPGEHKRVGMLIQETEVRDAVRDTEARKVEIARRVRDGTI